MYCAGWIGRGARGVIVDTTTECKKRLSSSFAFTKDALLLVAHTVAKRILEDIEQGRLEDLSEEKSGGDGLMALAQSRQIRCVSYEDWKRLDAYETSLGLKRGKPREKIIDLNQMLEITNTAKK